MSATVVCGRMHLCICEQDERENTLTIQTHKKSCLYLMSLQKFGQNEAQPYATTTSATSTTSSTQDSITTPNSTFNNTNTQKELPLSDVATEV